MIGVVDQMIGLHRLQQRLGLGQRQPVVGGLQVIERHGHVLAADPEKRAGIDRHRRNLAVAVEDDVLDAADVLVLAKYD